MNPKIAVFKDQFTVSVPEFYYHCLNRTFLFLQQDGEVGRQNWIEVNEQTAAEILATRAGIRAEREKGETLSPAKELLMAARMNTEKTVMYVGPLGGHTRGFKNMGAFNALITDSPRIPRPVKGDFRYIRAFMEGLFSASGGVQLPYVYSWLKISFEMLLAGVHRGMPALVMCGPRNCGKTFFQEHIVTPILGGRLAIGDRYLSGETTFNADLLTAEHICIGDPALSTTLAARREFGNRIKRMVACDTQSLHPKHRDAIPVQVFSRVTMSINDELENITQLPPMDKSVRDKYMLLLVKKFEWPVYAVTFEEKREFLECVHAEIPAFCWWLVNEFTVPAELTIDPDENQPARFCVNCYHHPYLLSKLTEVSPEFRLLELVRACFFCAPSDGGGVRPKGDTFLEQTALEIEQGLRSDDSPVRHEARMLLTTGARVTTYLERLNKLFPENVFRRRTSANRKWVIRDIDAVLDTVIS